MGFRDQHVGVLLGGLSDEREVSLNSGAAMADALARKGYRVTRIDVGRDLPSVLIREKIDVAVIALHGPLGEDGAVQGLLEVMGIPYTGSDVTSSALCMDKALSKALYKNCGLNTPPWKELWLKPDDSGQIAVAKTAEALADWRPPPLFVKPLNSGSSVGISKVEREDQLEEALAKAAAIHPRILVEREVAGVELALAVLDGESLPPIEIQPVEGFYDYENKYTAGRTRYLSPPESLSQDALDAAAAVARESYRISGCRGLARVDVIVDAEEISWVLEINTIPGMTATSLAPKGAAAAGITFDDLVERILNGASVG
ncbi:MAG: D-alanine--D-alanine ligase [Magnetococcales bacterium]|nr:D-alanine--D-alanine ligase [Magnetococcales bacterium]